MNLFSVVFYSSVSVKYVSETETREKSCETYFSAKIREFAVKDVRLIAWQISYACMTYNDCFKGSLTTQEGGR